MVQRCGGRREPARASEHSLYGQGRLVQVMKVGLGTEGRSLIFVWHNEVTLTGAPSPEVQDLQANRHFPAMGVRGRHGEETEGAICSLHPSSGSVQLSDRLPFQLVLNSRTGLLGPPSLDTCFLGESGDVGREGREVLIARDAPKAHRAPSF